MNRFLLALFLIAAPTLAGTPLAAQSLTGTWQITSEGPRGGALTQTLTLTQSGPELTGTIAITGGRRGGGGGRVGGGALGAPIAIADGSVDGSAFSFTTTVEFNGNSFTQRYSGTVEGDSMRGTVEGARGGSAPFTGSRGG